jgi:hypothetical protein
VRILRRSVDGYPHDDDPDSGSKSNDIIYGNVVVLSANDTGSDQMTPMQANGSGTVKNCTNLCGAVQG